MSLRRIDLRFVLPRLPKRAVVLGLDEWEEALRASGVDICRPEGHPDLAVAPSERTSEALSIGAESVILEGRRGRRLLEREGYATGAYLPLPGIEKPDLILPLGHGSQARYALSRWRPAATRLKRARNALAARLADEGIMPGRRRQILGSRLPGPPALIAAAVEHGVPAKASWFLTLGQGDDLTRGVFHLFAPEEREPAWVLKFARVPDYDEPFVRDEAGLSLAASAGPRVSARAPRLLGRLQVASHHASIETAAVGERLSTKLTRNGSGALAAIDEIAAWILQIGHETAAPADTLVAERRRLETEVVPTWGAGARLVTDIPELRAVIQHNDLGSWNIVWAGSGRFTAVDWEAARRYGFPLWDLLYFLVDVLPQLDGARSPEARAEGALRLLRGETASSPTLFAWIRRAVAENSLPPDAVGPVTTLCWLHHGLSHNARGEAITRVGGDPGASLPPVERIASAWLADPALGPGWSLWRAG